MQDINHFNLTQDGRKIYTDQSQQSMQIIDHYLLENLQFKQIEQISPSLFFQFGYQGILELEKIFSVLNQGQKLQSDQQAYMNFLKQNNIEITQIAQLNEISDYLNDLSHMCCFLYMHYQEQISDKFDKFFKFYNDFQQVNQIQYDRKTTFQFFIQRYKDQYHNLIDLQKQKLLSKSDYINESFKIEMNDYEDEDSLYREFQIQEDKKKEMVGGIYTFLIELDKFANRGIFEKNNSQTNYEEFIEDYNKSVQNFRLFDMRLCQEQWFNEKLNEYLQKIFQIRYKVEKRLNNIQMQLFDYELQKLLQIDTLKQSLKEELNQDMSTLKMLGEAFNFQKQSDNNDDVQLSKVKHTYLEKHVTDEIKNPDAFNKYISYTMSLQHKRNQYIDDDKDDSIYDNVQEEIETEERLQKDIYKKQHYYETDIQKLYQQVLQDENKADDQRSYFAIRQDMKQDIISALRIENNVQQGLGNSKDHQLEFLIKSFLKNVDQ